MESILFQMGDTITFDYTNWKGEKGKRTAVIHDLLYGSNQYHTEQQWLLVAYDLDKQAQRTFAMKDMSNVEFAEEAYVVRD